MKYYGFNENDYMAFGDQENRMAKKGIAVKDIDGSKNCNIWQKMRQGKMEYILS